MKIIRLLLLLSLFLAQRVPAPTTIVRGSSAGLIGGSGGTSGGGGGGGGGGATTNTLVITTIANNTSTTDQGRYNTASITPPNTALLLGFVASSKASAPDLPVLSGLGLNWVQIATITGNTAGTPTERLTIFRAQGSSYAPVFTDPVQLTFPDNVGGAVSQTGSIIEIVQITGAAITGFNGKNAVVQVTTGSGDASANPSITWAATSQSSNAVVVAFADNVASTADNTPAAGWTEIAERGYSTPAIGLTTEYKLEVNSGITTTATTATSRNWLAAAVEIKAGVSTDTEPARVGSNFAVDFWEDFEFTGAVSTGNLTAHDHIATGTWALFDAGSKLTGVAGAGHASISTWNGVTDSGGNGMRYDSTGEATAYWQFDFPASANSFTAAFDVRLPAELAGSFDEFDLEVVKSNTQNDDLYIKSTSSSSDGSINLRVFKPSIYSKNIVLSVGTWYHIMIKGVVNNPFLVRVYDNNGEQVQAEVTFSSLIWTDPFRTIYGGVYGGDFSHRVHSQTHDYDNFVVDVTTATWPLGP